MPDLAPNSTADGVLLSRYTLSATMTGTTGTELSLSPAPDAGLIAQITPFYVGPPGPPGEDSNKLDTQDW
jgi:hypothetical protein